MQKTYIDKLAFIHLKNGSVLETRTRGKDTWYIPGGKREDNETDEQALIRETKEELDIDIATDTIRYYGTFEAQAHGKSEGTMVRMACYTAHFIGTIKPTSEVEEIAYFTYADMGKTSPVDHLVFEDLKSKNLLG
jgi:8-oxo-dGTP diphosphatase